MHHMIVVGEHCWLMQLLDHRCVHLAGHRSLHFHQTQNSKQAAIEASTDSCCSCLHVLILTAAVKRRCISAHGGNGHCWLCYVTRAAPMRSAAAKLACESTAGTAGHACGQLRQLPPGNSALNRLDMSAPWSYWAASGRIRILMLTCHPCLRFCRLRQCADGCSAPDDVDFLRGIMAEMTPCCNAHDFCLSCAFRLGWSGSEGVLRCDDLNFE
jgi:hypothetical protein